MQKKLSPPNHTDAGHALTRDILELPAAPSFDFADMNFIVDIEVHAEQLLAYIEKLTSLADRACGAVIQQNETAQLNERNRYLEITDLRDQLESKSAQCHEQQIALVRLEEESKAQIALLESQLRLSELRQQQTEKDHELRMLRVEKSGLARRVADLEAVAPPALTQKDLSKSVVGQDAANGKLQRAKRDDSSASKNDAIRKIEANLNQKIQEFEQTISELKSELQNKEAQLKQHEAIIQATAAKELEMGNLIKRLSAECASLSRDLQEKTRAVSRLQIRMQPRGEPKMWRRVVGRLQEEPHS